LVGPDSLSVSSRRTLETVANITLLGPRPYRDVPAYLQHADVLVVPHKVNAFTESLDPIKAYECAVVGRPTVATPVPGFEGVGPVVEVVPADRFVGRVSELLDGPRQPSRSADVPTWSDRARAMDVVLRRAAGAVPPRGPAVP
jgi:teichuronic acid biosynthesis glycosyltransferase TuaH